MPQSSRNPTVEFEYDGETYEGESVGLAMPLPDSDKEYTKEIIKCSELDDSPVKIDQDKVKYTEG